MADDRNDLSRGDLLCIGLFLLPFLLLCIVLLVVVLLILVPMLLVLASELILLQENSHPDENASMVPYALNFGLLPLYHLGDIFYPLNFFRRLTRPHAAMF